MKRLSVGKGLTGFWPIARLLWAPAHVGPIGISHLIARPNYYRRLPRRMQNCLGVLPPAGSAWLRPRVEKKIPINIGCAVASVKRCGDQLELTPDCGRQRRVDHVLLATGYRVDISRYEFIAPRLLAAIGAINGYPRLNSRFECSEPGLHFMGAPAAWSFGPLMKFVAGAEFAAKTVTRGIVAMGKYPQPSGWNAYDRATQMGYETEDARLR
jgi:hypothetical protein